MKKFLLLLMTALFSTLIMAKEELRLVISAGALAEFDPYTAFYNSRLFRGDPKPPLMIVNGHAKAFETKNTLFYAADELTVADIIAAKEVKDAGTNQALSGNSYQAFLLRGTIPDEVTRYVGAESGRFAFEARQAGSKLILGFSKSHSAKKVVWPTRIDEISSTPAVTISDDKDSFLCIVKARRVGDLANKLAVIDALTNKTSEANSFIDLGSNHGMPLSEGALQALKKRNPLIFPGTTEIATLVQAPETLGINAVYPVLGHYRRTTTIKNRVLNWWSARGNERLWPIFNSLGAPITVSAMIDEMKRASVDPERALNIVRVFSEEAAKEAARSVYVDLVLLVAQDPFLQLPSREVIELKKAKTDAYEQIAPIVKVSYLDISEVTIFGPTAHNVDRVEIVRHSVSDEQPLAKDIGMPSYMANLAALPARSDLAGGGAWSSADLEKVLGGILLRDSGADIAVFESKNNYTPILGPVSFELAKSLVSPGGNMITMTLSGKQIKRINKLIGQQALNKQLTVYGMDTKAGRIAKRSLNDNEKFSVVLSEAALRELFGVSMLGGLGDEHAIRAPYIEAIYGPPLKDLFFIAGPRIIPVSDTADRIALAVNEIQAGRSIDEAISAWFAHKNLQALQGFLDEAKGKPHHVLTFDLSYFDLGISKNLTNATYGTYQKGELLPTSRGAVAPFTHVFIFTKSVLNYDAPSLITSLSSEIKYLYIKDDKPEKDKAKLGLKFRLPWERSVFNDSSTVLSPLLKLAYEVKLYPLFTTGEPEQKFDTLLGFNVDFTKLGFNIDVGAVMTNNLKPSKSADGSKKSKSFTDATDFGPGVNLSGKWPLFGPVELSSEIASYYLFALPNTTIPNKQALGVEGAVWLRLARFYDFSISAVSDFLVATLQNDPSRFAVSSIFGLTLSYGRFFRLFG